MLDYLHIRNLALIEDMSLELTPGINVLTGETGAGKSFILKALGFVLGDKFSSDIVRPGAEKAHVEALFRLDDKEVVLRRELSAASGRSRYYINDALSTQEAIRELRPQLISHTSQHAQQQLLQPAWQARLLESALDQPELLQKREALIAEIRLLSKQKDELVSRQAQLAEKRELLEMQASEIDKVAPRPGEEEELEGLRQKIRFEESARHNYKQAIALLQGDEHPGAIELLGDLEKLLKQLSTPESSYKEDIDAISALIGQLEELSRKFKRPKGIAIKHERDEIESRLFEFAQLKRKLKRTMPQILQLKDDIGANLSFLDACALDISLLNKKKANAEEELKKIIEQLRPERRASADNFARKLERELHDLGFSEHVRVTPDFEEYELLPGVMDERGRIYWAPNPGQKPQALDKIASGGELSRFLLGLNILSGSNENIIYIFDEVDAGVGGLTLNKVANKLEDFAQTRQVLLITHWPRLAAKANNHFQITKTVSNGETFTKCQSLNGKIRTQELARMAGGGKEGKALAENLIE